MIKLAKYSTLDQELRITLEACVHETFGHVPFVQERVWAQPDWAAVLYENEAIATFYQVVLRLVTIGSQVYKVAGVSNVITPMAYRGRGYASRILRETADFLFQELGCAYGLLLCADDLLPFYSRLNWYKVATTLYYDQPGGKQRYDSNVMLLAPANAAKLHPQSVDLNGLPW